VKQSRRAFRGAEVDLLEPESGESRRIAELVRPEGHSSPLVTLTNGAQWDRWDRWDKWDEMGPMGPMGRMGPTGHTWGGIQPAADEVHAGRKQNLDPVQAQPSG
jgi:hypothetical protein